jgi:hypothetical protein
MRGFLKPELSDESVGDGRSAFKSGVEATEAIHSRSEAARMRPWSSLLVLAFVCNVIDADFDVNSPIDTLRQRLSNNLW